LFREKANKNQGTRSDLNFLQKSVKSEKVNTQKEIAKLAGVSHDTIDKKQLSQISVKTVYF